MVPICLLFLRLTAGWGGTNGEHCSSFFVGKKESRWWPYGDNMVKIVIVENGEQILLTICSTFSLKNTINVKWLCKNCLLFYTENGEHCSPFVTPPPPQSQTLKCLWWQYDDYMVTICLQFDISVEIYDTKDDNCSGMITKKNLTIQKPKLKTTNSSGVFRNYT